MMEKQIVGVLAMPGEDAKAYTVNAVDGSYLDGMQAAVDGYIERVSNAVPGYPGIDLWVNEEFLLRDDCEPNRMVHHIGVVYGPMLFLGNDGFGESCSLTVEETEAVMAEYGPAEQWPDDMDKPEPRYEFYAF